MRSTYRYRSFFWPALLILVGVVALLANTGQIPTDRLYNLVLLWPLILVVLGLELIVRRSMHGVAGDIAAALIIVLAVVGAAAYVAAAPSPAASQSFERSGEVASLESATLEIDAGAAQVTVSGSSDLGSNLYRAHIDYSGPRPEVTFDPSSGALRISEPRMSFFDSLQNRRFVLDLKLNPSIPWTISANTGASTSTYNLQSVHLAGLTLNTGASRDDINLGKVTGIVPVHVNGGALTVHVHRPKGTQASLDVSGGALSVDADGHHYGGFGHASNSVDLGTDGYKVEVNGGACTVTLDTATASD
jgi:hypothetical protein